MFCCVGKKEIFDGGWRGGGDERVESGFDKDLRYEGV